MFLVIIIVSNIFGYDILIDESNKLYLAEIIFDVLNDISDQVYIANEHMRNHFPIRAKAVHSRCSSLFDNCPMVLSLQYAQEKKCLIPQFLTFLRFQNYRPKKKGSPLIIWSEIYTQVRLGYEGA